RRSPRGKGRKQAAGVRFGQLPEGGTPAINSPRMERDLSRRPISILCLILCTALLWGAWRLTETTESAGPLPDLQFFPFRTRRTPATPPRDAQKRQPAAARLPAEKMPIIRVGLLPDPARSVTIEVSEPFVVRPPGSDKVLYQSAPIGPTTVLASRAGLKIGKRELAAAQVEIIPAKSPAVWVEGHEYRGTVRLHRQGSGAVTAVNVVPLEDYIASVVDSEMPAAFPDEARKAQAIVARTYALYQKQVAEPAAIADLFASTRSQKYLGYQYREGGRLLAGESEAGRKIAAATRGKVCHYRDRIFCTYYCAVCGGSTVKGTEVFADAAPPLVSVKCDYCREARLYRWTAEISKTDMQKELAPWFREKGQNPGPLKTVSLARTKPAAGTLPEFDVRTGRQSVRISGIELRQLLVGRGLYSPRFTIEDKGTLFEIAGSGHGHGVGLCQWGARGQALEGRTCEQILKYYYPGATIATRVWK
ncbi:MAG: SpoIID/LytB domain-containing protein, partial [Deltaproteobacteria bacterium]